MKRSIAVQKGLPILGVFRAFTAIVVDLAIKGVGLAAAIPAAVKAISLELVQKGLPTLSVFRTFTAIGFNPAIMGVGPATAILVAVKAVGLKFGDIDLSEINEAFASQFIACPNKLELDLEKFNANGRATGACCVATQLHEMKRHGKDCRFGVISMCIGSRMGEVAIFERGDAVDDFCDPGYFKKQVFYLRMQAL
ncbi:hypothetical protein SO802_026897 [Lithocarpus litseifolius]|uniref:Thiolase C-terminal domain-containing protein n=1 Tax=Lithocarpus litseifolius TaxID=425828 RepID=A0AAW2C2T4_9ROSI